jgi:outer membrane receptor protein involved in Fe transport
MLRTSRQYVDVGNTQQIPGWTRFDVGARYAFKANGTPMVVRATVENVFNKNYWQSAAREGLTVGGNRPPRAPSRRRAGLRAAGPPGNGSGRRATPR